MAEALTIRITGDVSGVDAALQDMNRAMTTQFGRMEQRLESAERATQQFAERSARHLETLQRSFTAVQATVTRVMGVLASVGVGFSLGTIAQQAIETAASFEQLDTQLRFVVGTMEDF